MADVASSSTSILLWRTIARARAMICLCPTEKLFPPAEIMLSKFKSASRVCLNLYSSNSAASCSRSAAPIVLLSSPVEVKPAARRASYNVASSCSSNGSRLRRSVPLRRSGFDQNFSTIPIGTKESLTTWGIVVMFERRTSRLRRSVTIPSYMTVPSVMMQRRSARISEL